ncbi:MAG TPA: helix-turn-helix transcriptional regulator [Alphaproteobacteria bacterium]|nr:helix-turn-helix transcriptional regulator [Alphaproteobacteria bacterium]
MPLRFKYDDQAGQVLRLADHSAFIAALGSRYAMTERERQLLCALLSGMSNKQIAWLLEIETATVKSYMTPLFRKLGVKTRLQAALAVFELAARHVGERRPTVLQ